MKNIPTLLEKQVLQKHSVSLTYVKTIFRGEIVLDYERPLIKFSKYNEQRGL